jgi:hypothetical protein
MYENLLNHPDLLVKKLIDLAVKKDYYRKKATREMTTANKYRCLYNELEIRHAQLQQEIHVPTILGRIRYIFKI